MPFQNILAKSLAPSLPSHSLKPDLLPTPTGDTATSGTPAMLNAILTTTLLDDVSSADPTTNALESYLATLFGYEAAILTVSGTMCNQLAIRAHLAAPPHSVVADARSHIVIHEAGGMVSLSQAMPFVASPSGGRHHLVLEDVKAAAVLSDNIHMCPTKLVCLENTIRGAVTPPEECARIAQWARANGLAMHLDGARIWEAVSAQVARGEHGGDYVTGLRAYAASFDSIQACFSKGLGAPMGSILMGSKALIDKARHHRKAIGGGIRAAGIIAAPARVALDETFFGGKLVATHILAQRVAEMWQARGGQLAQPLETNHVWLDLEHAKVDDDAWQEAAKEAGITLGQGRIVCHYQLCEDAIARLGQVFDKFLGAPKSANGA